MIHRLSSTPQGTNGLGHKQAHVPIQDCADIVAARRRGRELALCVGFSETESTMVATIISELARNIVLYAEHGEVVIEPSPHSLTIIGRDQGPGIADVERALAGGYSTSGGLGLGLCGVYRMVDDLEIETAPGQGTTVVARKWLR